jgi:hypothetical protein
MGTRDLWIFLVLCAGFSAVLCLVTVLVAQIETFVPGRKTRALNPEPEEKHQERDEPTAA